MDIQFNNLTDEDVIRLARNGNQDATEYMLKKYSPLVKKSIRTLYLIGADTEDLSQEGMIGLFKAVQNYKDENQASFYTFAKVCIDRQIYSAIKASNRKKHSPLNTYISFYSRGNEEEMQLIENLEASRNSNPEHVVLDQENASRIENLLQSRLSKMEKEVLPLYLEGLSYSEIAERLGKQAKSIDNTVQRIRDKVKKLYIEQGK
ncbi:MAG: sigma-70 family RNA polymerase sigma factor [Lachnospiraceae bacterium]|nr:sigma-70 family RNA polymerase sigma factor [Lachnospiraceae bacterium]